MEYDPKTRYEYQPSQWGEDVPFDGKVSIGAALDASRDTPPGNAGLVRLNVSDDNQDMFKRLWHVLKRKLGLGLRGRVRSLRTGAERRRGGFAQIFSGKNNWVVVQFNCKLSQCS